MATNQIEEVKNKTDIVSLISEYIEVKKAGRNYKANCPFHGEKTPSFMITPELQMYKCFGCGRHGDCFTFLEEHEGMEFGDALKYLAERAGIKLVLQKDESSSEKEKIFEINKSAVNFFDYALNNHPEGKKVKEYLTKDRGLSDESINLFKIGYSPTSFGALTNYLTVKKKFKIADIEKTGLIVGGGKTFDRFRGRVIFPLMDHRNEVVGFAGRILPWAKQDMAKYINSPETVVYHKSKLLYGLNITKGDIRSSKFAIVVEGELDMISSYSSGIKNVVAIKGSVLTEDQIRLIGRFCQRIVLCLDSDFAGDEAAKRGAIMAINMGFDVKVAHLKKFKDPDEAARNDPEGYRRAIEEAASLWDFMINQIFNKYDLGSGSGRSQISKEVVPLLTLIQDKIVQSFYVELVARKLSVSIETVFSEIDKIKQIDKNIVSQNNYQQPEKSRRLKLEEKLLVNCVGEKKEFLFSDEIKSLVSDDFILKIITHLQEKGLPLPVEFQTRYAEMVLENSEKEDVETIVKELTILDTKQKLEDIAEKIKKDENSQDLLKEFSNLSKKLSAL
ncbi:MAG: DNA primase [Microgenomates group bacterium]